MSQSVSDHHCDRTNSEQQKPKLLSCQNENLYTINSSAPGKFILSGEYSVVYGKHAVAVSIDMRTSVSIRPNNHNDIVRVELKDFHHVRSWPVDHLRDYHLVSEYYERLNFSDTLVQKLSPLMDTRYITSKTLKQQTGHMESNNNTLQTDDNVEKSCQDAILAFLMSYLSITDSYISSHRPALDVQIESQLPIGCGLGSSSAYAVALCGALLKLTDMHTHTSQKLASEWAYQIDRYFHGTPSGIDNNIIAQGGSMLFQKGAIKQQNNNSNYKALTSILIDTCVARSTKTLCNKLASRINDSNFDSNKLFDNIDQVTLSVWNELQSSQYNKTSMDALLTKNQQLLDELGVGHNALTDIIDCCRKYEYCAKMTGAGGGGMAFVLIDNSSDPNLDDLKCLLTFKGYKYYETSMGGNGLEVELSLVQ